VLRPDHGQRRRDQRADPGGHLLLGPADGGRHARLRPHRHPLRLLPRLLRLRTHRRRAEVATPSGSWGARAGAPPSPEAPVRPRRIAPPRVALTAMVLYHKRAIPQTPRIAHHTGRSPGLTWEN